jgi:thymidylate synthase (FAD)
MIEVTYIDHMGSDLSVVNAARVSFGKKSDWMPRVHEGEEKVLSQKDSKLIKYLEKHRHKSPFNHTFATFHVRAPIFVARQLVKHEYMPWNEVSRRYVNTVPDFYEPTTYRRKADDKKQGSGDSMVPSSEVMRSEAKVILWAKKTYGQMLKEGVCPEQARMLLPQSMMTEWYWSGTVFAFAKMCGLRCKDDTQAETRFVADAIDEEMENLYPVAWKALRLYKDGK